MALLEIKNLTVLRESETGQKTLVSAISLHLPPGAKLAICGESGSGKTMLCRALVSLLPRGFRLTGEIRLESGRFSGKIDHADQQVLEFIRGRIIGFVFQDTPASLNPVLKCGRQLSDVIATTQNLLRLELATALEDLLVSVGFENPRRIMDAFPFELSGGMQQRVALAMALAGKPEILIVDEPSTALDAIARRDLIDLLNRRCQETGLSVIIVTHDLLNVHKFADHLLVMYAGEAIESGPAANLIEAPHHPYTQLLTAAWRALLNNQPFSPNAPEFTQNVPGCGCRFVTRCPNRRKVCLEESPPMTVAADGRCFHCHFPSK